MTQPQFELPGLREKAAQLRNMAQLNDQAIQLLVLLEETATPGLEAKWARARLEFEQNLSATCRAAADALDQAWALHAATYELIGQKPTPERPKLRVVSPVK